MESDSRGTPTVTWGRREGSPGSKTDTLRLRRVRSRGFLDPSSDTLHLRSSDIDPYALFLFEGWRVPRLSVGESPKGGEGEEASPPRPYPKYRSPVLRCSDYRSPRTRVEPEHGSHPYSFLLRLHSHPTRPLTPPDPTTENHPSSHSGLEDIGEPDDGTDWVRTRAPVPPRSLTRQESDVPRPFREDRHFSRDYEEGSSLCPFKDMVHRSKTICFKERG